ncbi:MAG: hypothetical protein V4501_08325, partial [Pseudomonadota bacterium]
TPDTNRSRGLIQVCVTFAIPHRTRALSLTYPHETHTNQPPTSYVTHSNRVMLSPARRQPCGIQMRPA